MALLDELGARAKKASRAIAAAGAGEKNRALLLIADALIEKADVILEANGRDISCAEENGVPPHMVDRLALSPERIAGISEGVRQVAALKDPVGEGVSSVRHENGMEISRVRVPLGVIGIIFEARPNVTVDAAALCLKAGNAVILRGGKDAIHSNTALVKVMRGCLSGARLPEDCVCLVEDTSRASAVALMGLSEYVDVLIPRGGAGLIRTVVENASVPVIETGVGNCHVYIDSAADLDMGARIIFNAKCSRPSVCNAAETLLVAEDVAKEFLPMAKALLDTKNVELRGCEKTRSILGNCVKEASEDDYFTEFSDYILAVKVIASLEEAMAHIAKHGTGHSEAIVTADYGRAQAFLSGVDAAAVYVNASTRFTDGFEFGLGAEIGISTQKMHARGPMGLTELTSTKFIIRGGGQVRG